MSHLSTSALTCLAATCLIGCPDGPASTVDNDKDGATADLDCDDGNPAVYPGGVEVCANGVDEDCDGADGACPADGDLDGYSLGDGDCDDGDPAVNPGATEDCTNAVDDDCNGIAASCLGPQLVYTPVAQGLNDATGVAVFGDRIVFGDPGAVLHQQLGDGRAALFTFSPGGYVDELDAVTLAPGAVGAVGAYGVVINPVGGRLCISADYHDWDPLSPDAGKSWCFSGADVRTAGATLPLTAADYTGASSVTEAFAAVDAEIDADGDGLAELAIYSADGIHLIDGNGAAWAGDYVGPDDAEQTIPCGSPSYWCGFARGYGPDAVGISGPGGSRDSFDLYHLPLPAGAPIPSASYTVDRFADDSAVYVPSADVFAVGSSTTGAVYFVDRDAIAREVLAGPTGTSFGHWVDVMTDQDGHELLLVGAPNHDFGHGRVWVFDLTLHGLPTTEQDAPWILDAGELQVRCGTRARGGILTDADGIHTTIAISCPGTGGAAFKLDSRPLPAPLVRAADVYPTTPAGHYNVRRWVVDAFTGKSAWAHTLAQVEAVKTGTTITGWRLHGVAAGSPLHRAGLRTGDLIKKVNDTAVTTPAVVRQLVSALSTASVATLRLTRAGVARTFTYHVVP